MSVSTSTPQTIRIGPDSLLYDEGKTRFVGSKERFEKASKEGPHKTVFIPLPTASQKLPSSKSSSTQLLPSSKSSSSSVVVKYKGSWTSNKKHGLGTATMSDGCVYIGEWVNGKREGKGTFYFCSSSKDKGKTKTSTNLKMEYEGDWYQGHKHGSGVHVDPRSGDRYTGEFYNNLKHGSGEETVSNKSVNEVYEGEFKANKRSGYGTLTNTLNNDKYEGSFYDGMKEGPGKFYYGGSGGKMYCGEWVGGMCKCGEYTYGDADNDGGDGVDGVALPMLTLESPQTVLSATIADIRQDRAELSGNTANPTAHVSRFNEEDMTQIRLAFDAFSTTDLLNVSAFEEVFNSLGIRVEEGVLEGLLEELGIEEGDEVFYEEFVDIVVVVSGGI